MCTQKIAAPEAALEGGQVDHADVGSLVTVIREVAAAIVARPGTGILIDVVLHYAGLAHLAGDRQSKRRRDLRLRGQG